MTDSLRARLDYEPQVLKFGTSGRRGEVVHLTQLEIYINALAELQYLQSLPANKGGIRVGDDFVYAYDLRPSSTRFVPEQMGRGEIAQAIVRAIHDSSMRPVNLGHIPTPALAFYALEHAQGGMMVTGSHIPFERNGYKTYSAKGELLKEDEAPINERVEQVRARLYAQLFRDSIFNEQGFFKSGHEPVPTASSAGRDAYVARYVHFFAGRTLAGKQLLVYEHSAVGRDLLAEILERLGATVIRAGRSDKFIPIDTENIETEQLRKIQALLDEAWAAHGPIDAVVSTDGDSDRPLVLGVESSTSGGSTHTPARARFFSGDLLGMMVAEYLGADGIVVPISCNDAIDLSALKDHLEPKTRIGSPFVIAGMEKARCKGRRAVCGWEANGGFLTGSAFSRGGRILKALPTRDALLPILTSLFSAQENRVSLVELFARLPKRFGKAALLKNFPRAVSQQMVKRFAPPDERSQEILFTLDDPKLLDENLGPLACNPSFAQRARAIQEELSHYFTSQLGFGAITKINYTDGVRVSFSNHDVAHFRPSGNADELRIYSVADTQTRADAIAAAGVAEPDGILRRLARSV